MSPFSLPAGLWWVVAALLLVDLALLAAAQRPVALRLWRIGVLCVVALVVRTLGWWVGFAVQSPVELALMAAALAGAVLLLFSGRVWLVRDDLPHFRQQVETAARRLFLTCEESPPGRFEFPTGADPTCELRVMVLLPRLLLVVLPRAQRHSKIALLRQWFAKQYSGPIPRLHIVLKRSPS